MTEDEPFLQAILANPDDRVSRLVYADWLDERADQRAEFLRLDAKFSQLAVDDAGRAGVRQRLSELRTLLPSWWLALVGGVCATFEDDPVWTDRVASAARSQNRAVTYTDAAGYEIAITAAATCGRSGAVVYLESRSQWRGTFHDINYYLRLRDPAGRATTWEPYTYNPYFGCDARFLEWFGDVAVFIYREKHRTYVARVGFDHRPNYIDIADDWVLNGREIGYRGYRETTVRRLSLPELEPLAPLDERDAAARELWPRARW